jgi:hypothetical protein
MRLSQAKDTLQWALFVLPNQRKCDDNFQF